MKLPKDFSEVTLSGRGYETPYPPLGFTPFLEHQLGNGDTFGLYWPIGYEDRDPIVAETYHDEWSIQPHFSSLERFLAATAGLADRDEEDSDELDDDELDDDEFDEDDEFDDDDDAHVGAPSLDEDPHSPAACLLAAQECLRTQDVQGSIALLERAVSILPEFGEAQALLCTQYRRLGRNNDAIQAAIQAIISPPCFGAPPINLVRWLASQSNCGEDAGDDPIWISRQRLTFNFGGAKENDDYNILREAIDAYLAQSRFIQAMTLMQTYAQLMYSETVSFQDRYAFNVDAFTAWQKEVASSSYGKPREIKAY